MNYGLTFWGNSSFSNSIFKLQKRIIRIIMGAGNRETYRELFKTPNILPLQSQYILSLMLFLGKNKNKFQIIYICIINKHDALFVFTLLNNHTSTCFRNWMERYFPTRPANRPLKKKKFATHTLATSWWWATNGPKTCRGVVIW
jgi:hypothetical protein